MRRSTLRAVEAPADDPEIGLLPAGGPLGVRVVAGPDLGRAAAFVDEVLRIGTGDDNHLRLTDPTVSPRHAELYQTAEGVVLRDLGSRTGTFVRGTPSVRVYRRWNPPVPPGHVRIKEVHLHPADPRFRLGDTVLELAVLDAVPHVSDPASPIVS